MKIYLTIALTLLFMASECVFVEEDVKRMGKYEIIKFDVDDDINPNLNDQNWKVPSAFSFSFSAFGNKYDLSLTINHGIIGNNISDHEGRRGGRGYLSELRESCHYHVKFSDSNNGEKGFGGLSICPGDGLRGRLIGYNDTLIIGPAKRYLNIDDEPNYYHKICDKHLMYRMSDYNDDNYNIMKSDFTSVIKEKDRRKLLSNDNQVGLYVICDVSMYESYYSIYGDNSWESQILSDAANYINDVSSNYENAEWGRIGNIKIVFVQFDVLKSFNGNFASLNPGASDSNVVNGADYLNKISTWSAMNINYDSIDHLQLWTKYSFTPQSTGMGLFILF